MIARVIVDMKIDFVQGLGRSVMVETRYSPRVIAVITISTKVPPRHGSRCIITNMDVPVQLRDTVCVLGTSQNLALRMVEGVYLEVFTVVVVVICCGTSVWGQGAPAALP